VSLVTGEPENEMCIITRSQAVARIADRILPYSIDRCKIASPAVFEILGSVSVLKSRVQPFGVTWCHRSCDHLIHHRPFSVGDPMEPITVSVSNGFQDIQWW